MTTPEVPGQSSQHALAALETDRRESTPSIKAQGSGSRLKMRKKSFSYRSSVPGITGAQSGTRTSQIAIECRRPMMVYLPTYQLEPFRPFKTSDVTKIVDSMLDENCPKGYKYDANESPKLAMTLALDIMRAVKAENYDRYRIIAVVTIGQKRSQSYNNTVSFIWDGSRDKYVDSHREFTTAIIQATVFGVYFD